RGRDDPGPVCAVFLAGAGGGGGGGGGAVGGGGGGGGCFGGVAGGGGGVCAGGAVCPAGMNGRKGQPMRRGRKGQPVTPGREDLAVVGERVSAARAATEARGETFYPGASRVQLAAFPPKERWDDWVELSS